MAQQTINIGTADAKQGDNLFTGGNKINDNFTELYTSVNANPVVFVTSESSFLTQDATTITLESGVVYEMAESVTTAKRFICENNSLIRSYAQSTEAVLTYTGAGDMFSGTNVSPTIKEMKIDCPSGQAFNFKDTISNTSFLFIDNITVISCAKLGTFTNMGGFVLNRSAAADATDGISLVGSNFGIFSVSLSAINSTSASFIAVDYGSAILQTNEITNLNSDAPVGSIWLSGLANSGNVPAGKLAMVTNCELGPDIAPTQNIVNSDIRWDFQGNNRIPDSITDAMASLTSNVTETVITTINTPVKVAGTWVIEREARFIVDATGRLTYIGERDIVLPLDATITINSASGTNKDITGYIALNGSIINNSQVISRVGATDPRNISLHWQQNMSTNDYIELFVENNSDTINLVASHAINRAR